MMAVHVCFTFAFIRVCGIKQGKILSKIPSGLSHLIDASGNKMAHNSILRDLFMLENQIPFFVRDGGHDGREGARSLAKTDISFPPHEFEVGEFGGEGEKEGMTAAEAFAEPTHLRKLVNIVWAMVSKLVRGPIELMKRMMFSKPMKVLVKLPWTIVSFSIKTPLVCFCSREPSVTTLNASASRSKHAERNLYDLVSRNLVVVGEVKRNGQIKTCRLHIAIYGFCKFRAVEQEFYHEITMSEGVLDSPASLTPNHRRLCIDSCLS